MAPRRPPVQHHEPEPPAGTVIRVYRHTPADHFTIVPNTLARGRLPVPLRALARCLLIHLLSLPAGWEITRAEINRAFVEGRDAVSAGIHQLREAGYLRQERGHDDTTGQFAWRWEVTDDPAAFVQVSTIDGFSVDGERQPDPEPENSRSAPSTDSPSTAEPSTVNQSMATTYLEDLTSHLPPPSSGAAEPVVDPVVVEAHEVLEAVNSAAPRGRMGRHQIAKLTPDVAEVLRAGIWTPAALREHLADNLTGIKSVHAVTRYRLDDLPDTPPAMAPTRPARPPWCGTCDEHTRYREDAERNPYRCPDCHPLATSGERPGHVDVAPAASVATRAAAKAAIAATLTGHPQAPLQRHRRRQATNLIG
jgi:hypothetical protein